ncbi:ABC transporter permease [Agromyces albus]|uniref:ABC transporter permease n=1 Tax=Agromyces albus TaxID=205332 RepID=UPI002786EDF9|nr:ABC transporter permease [Agromyces albus]MDQ0573826.1 branched-chain amino acid transport system permease protein [Agromyces albus]
MLDLLFAGLVNGNAYALVALGLSLVIGVANVVNFAHGSLFAVGAMTGWFVTSNLGLPLWAGALAAIVVTALLGYLINLVAVRPFAGRAPIAAVLSTIAVMIILDNLTQMVFGPQVRRFDSGLPDATFQVGGLSVGLIDLIILTTGVTLMVVLALGLRFTKIGRAIRATSQDREAAEQMGVPTARVQSIAFMVASGLGGLAGVLVAAYFTTIAPTQGFQIGLAGIAAATLGGLGSLLGAVVGGLVLGVVEAFGVGLWGDSVRQLITFGVLLAVLWIRPEGLFGKKAIKREPLSGTFFSQARPIIMKRWQVAVLIALAIVPAIPGLFNGYTVQIGIQVLSFAMIALSMTIIGGAAGQLSLGQAGPVAIGAYTAALLTRDLAIPFTAALLIAGLVSAVIVTLLAAPSWKLSGHYPAIATLATGAAISAVILVAEPLTGGGSGLSLIPLPEILGFQFNSTTSLYALGLGILLAIILVVHRLGTSHLGLYWRATRDDEIAARSAGIATPQYKSLAFGIGGFIAGVGGAFWAAQFGYVDPKIFSPNLSFQIVIIAVLGSMLRPFGAVLGAIVLVGGLELFRAAAETRLLVYGLVLLLLVRFRPQGLWTLPLPLAGLVRRITGRTPRPDAPSAIVPSVKLAGSLAPTTSADTPSPMPDGDGAASAPTTPKEVHA